MVYDSDLLHRIHGRKEEKIEPQKGKPINGCICRTGSDDRRLFCYSAAQQIVIEWKCWSNVSRRDGSRSRIYWKEYQLPPPVEGEPPPHPPFFAYQMSGHKISHTPPPTSIEIDTCTHTDRAGEEQNSSSSRRQMVSSNLLATDTHKKIRDASGHQLCGEFGYFPSFFKERRRKKNIHYSWTTPPVRPVWQLSSAITTKFSSQFSSAFPRRSENKILFGGQGLSFI